MDSNKLPLISVITPTYRSGDLLIETMEMVREQQYPNLEHVIVADGCDTVAEGAVRDYQSAHPYDVPVRYFECGKHWSSIVDDSMAAGPIIVGSLLARGDYQIWACDDERFDTDHISRLYNLLVGSGVDFTYSRVLMYEAKNPHNSWRIGSYPPRYGQITNFLYKSSLLNKGMYQMHTNLSGDWDLVNRWLAEGASCAMLNEVTMTHRGNH